MDSTVKHKELQQRSTLHLDGVITRSFGEISLILLDKLIKYGMALRKTQQTYKEIPFQKNQCFDDIGSILIGGYQHPHCIIKKDEIDRSRYQKGQPGNRLSYAVWQELDKQIKRDMPANTQDPGRAHEGHHK